jgi:CubicO group peptidase (beta-lactamase class C family)
MKSRSGGFSQARLGRMRDVMAAHVEHGDIPGLVTLVSRRDEVHVEAIGRKADGGEPMRRDTIFRIASMTKPIAAGCCPSWRTARSCGGSTRRSTTRCPRIDRSRCATC